MNSIPRLRTFTRCLALLIVLLCGATVTPHQDLPHALLIFGIATGGFLFGLTVC